ncbi:flavin mononucleotide hydrolase 1, chloroplatic [Abrus precatorius]|uniref:Flavin mononucleotide hydrolase 1, chloroplatic n=1 Tax=Abrus precatorius TaxID=3816 RepID=A0A8B8LF88_ABRPR|nr:flavin mononucleotide hydrolase 1, chloroplatic [Abrus precatorius]
MVSMGIGVPSISICCLFQAIPTKHLYLKLRLKPSLSSSITSMAFTNNSKRKVPILLFDIMDTLVRDPFYQDVPAFFGMSLKELIDCKHPTSWIEFEKGLIDEMELARKFFKDGRDFDLEGLKTCMRSGYSYIEGIEQLLLALKKNNYEMHAFTNYPVWYQLIEGKLKLSKYLSWTFCSCKHGKRKPDTEFYMEVLRHLQVDPENCIFVDDRQKNVEAAIEVGIRGVHLKNVNLLREELSLMGIDISTDEDQ